MEKPKPTQSLEQKQETPEDYVVATFPVDIDPDNARRPLTVIRSGQDGEDVKYDRGWNPIGMSVVCDTDSEKGIGPIKLLMEAYKLVGTYIKTEFVPLEDIQGLNEDYIKYLYGKTPEEMLKEGAETAEQIWRQKHPVGSEIESLAPEVGSDSGAESPSNSSVEDTSGHEKSLADEVSPAMGGVAVEAAGVEKPIYTNKVKTNEPVRELVETDKTGVGPPALVMTKEVLESIGAIKVNDPAGLSAVEPVKKPVEADKASATPADLLAAKSVENPVTEKSMETNETNAGILPEDFKAAINEFKRLTKDNNNQFAGVARSLTGSLSEFRESITRTPTAIKGFIDEGFSEEMFVDSKKDPAKATGILVRKLEGLGEILRGVYAGYSGRDSLVQAIDEVIVDLSTVSRDRWGILDAVNKIKSVWGDDKS